jgi:hypothetical protein
VPLYNMVPERGYPAELGVNIASKAIVLYTRLRPRTGSYGVTVASPGIPEAGDIRGNRVSLFGVPSERNGTGGAPMPLVSNPADCLEAEPSTKLWADSWQYPGRTLDPGSSDFGAPDPTDPIWRTAIAPVPPVTGCDRQALASQFAPKIDARPTPGAGTSQADEPSGYTVSLDFPQSNDPTDSSSTFDPSIPSPPPLKNATVTLPAGVTISPSAADGLEGCSDQADDPSGDQVHYDTTNPVTCPEASKIGSVVATSPLLAQRDPATDEVIGADPVGGEVFVLRPHPGDLGPGGGQDGTFRVLIEVSSAKYGINIKLPGIVTANRDTGQLTATFLENPQLLVKHLELKFKPGPRASLANPVTCGTFTTTSDLVPWSTPGTPDAHPSSAFQVSSGANGAVCPSTPQDRPFVPSMSAGMESAVAGASAPFVLKLTRNDGEQELGALNLTMPPGFTARLAGIPYCSDAAIATATANSGAAEAADSSCPAASQLGSVTVGAGPGSNPFYVNGKAYLAGPYKGAPLSLAFITPAVAGTFDLGSVVVRSAVFIDPHTAQVRVRTDSIPQIIDGVPLHIRSIVARIDRSNFTLNPTNCNSMTLAGEAVGSSGASAALSSHFQVGGCAALPFKPSFSASTSGKTSKANGASLVVKVSQKAGEANIQKVNLTIPIALPARLTTLQKACTEAQFAANPAGCPAASVIGSATARTPLLATPLTGPAYLVSHGGAAFPDVVFMLQANEQGAVVRVDLVGGTQIKKDITYSRFESVPDAPISSFETTLPQGPHSVLSANGSLCQKKLTMPTELAGQNGAIVKQNTKIAVTGCPKKATLTRAQKLAAALKACKKKHRAKRAACARTARRQYATAVRKPARKR